MVFDLYVPGLYPSCCFLLSLSSRAALEQGLDHTLSTRIAEAQDHLFMKFIARHLEMEKP